MGTNNNVQKKWSNDAHRITKTGPIVETDWNVIEGRAGRPLRLFGRMTGKEKAPFLGKDYHLSIRWGFANIQFK